MEKENLNELLSTPVTTYNDFYNEVSKNLDKVEQIKLMVFLMISNHNLLISDEMKRIILQPQESFNSFYNRIKDELTITEKKNLLKLLRVVSSLQSPSQNDSKTIVREKTMHKNNNVL